jgi:hypothetical protein
LGCHLKRCEPRGSTEMTQNKQEREYTNISKLHYGK